MIGRIYDPMPGVEPGRYRVRFARGFENPVWPWMVERDGCSGSVAFTTWREAQDYADRKARTREYVLPRIAPQGPHSPRCGAKSPTYWTETPMSIDYAQLRALAEYSTPGPWRTDEHPYMDGQNVYNAEGFKVAQHLSGNNADFIVMLPEIAAELLRLRDEIEATRDRVAQELERTPTELQAARITLHAEREHTLAFCNHLLEGDTE